MTTIVVVRGTRVVFGSSVRHGLRDRAHAADGIAPDTGFAIDLAERVMQQHIGRTCRIQTREVADYRIEAEHCLDGIGFEPAVEHIACRSAEELERGLETVGLPKLSADRREFGKFAHSLTEAA